MRVIARLLAIISMLILSKCQVHMLHGASQDLQQQKRNRQRDVVSQHWIFLAIDEDVALVLRLQKR